METRWTEFQRSCVQHIAGLLGSIRGLVGTLGPDALGNYCQHGCLGNECLDRVKLASFSKPDKDVEAEDQESGDEESGDEEYVDEEVRDEEVGDEAMGDEDMGDEEFGSEETGNEGSKALDSYGQPGCLNNDCADKIPLANSTKPGDDEGPGDQESKDILPGDEEPGNEEFGYEESEDEESGDEETEYEDEESENADEESEDEDEKSEDDTE